MRASVGNKETVREKGIRFGERARRGMKNRAGVGEGRGRGGYTAHGVYV